MSKEHTSNSEIINTVSNFLSSTSKFLYFLTGLNGTVLGFLFSQSALGKLNGINKWLNIVWLAFGLCFIICLLCVWVIIYLEAKFIVLVGAGKQYIDYLYLERDEYEHVNPATKLHIRDVEKLLKENNDSYFIEKEKALTDSHNETLNFASRFWFKNLGLVIALFHIITYGGSIVLGTYLIKSKPDILLQEKLLNVLQSPLKIDLGSLKLKVENDSTLKSAYLVSSPESSPAATQPSPAPESSLSQTPQSLPQH